MLGKKKEEPKLPKLSDEELLEFEAYFRQHDNDSGAHRPDIALQACVGLLLLELIRKNRE